MSELPFTGERFTPECLREIWYEHYHRYAFARSLVKGRQVADVACGEGYGAALLAGAADSVVGVDIDPASVAHARQRYSDIANLRFECADATRLPFADASLDALTSFETIEHLHAQAELIAEFARVLKPDGLLILSSPDKRTYSETRDYHNEFHVRELYREELLALLTPAFPALCLYGQKLLFQSLIWTLDRPPQSVSVHTLRAASQQLLDTPEYPPLYFIAVCAKAPTALPASVDLDLFGDAEESVYRHYEAEIRKNMQAGAVLAEREAALLAERAAHAATQTQLRALIESTTAQTAALSPRPWWRRLF
ncbi:MAG: class I SAM-dependent methyltransferase [Lysobacterales bacterium]